MSDKKLKPFDRMHGGINFEGELLWPTAVEHKDAWIYQKKYYDIAKAKGFDHIRVPCNFELHVIGDAPDYTINPEYLKALETAVNLALEVGLIIVLDFHGSGCYRLAPEKFVKLWEQVAAYFKDFPEELMFEIVNEPCGGTDEQLNDVQLKAVAAIRKTNPTRGIALACNQWNGTWKMLSVDWPENDENCFLSIHNYYMMEFTHQGVYWDKPERPGHVRFNKYIGNQIKEHLDFCADYQKLYGRRVWISECGVFQQFADASEIAKYTKHLTEQCARFDLPYAYWEFNIGFGLYSMERDDWKNEVMQDMVFQW